MKFLYTLLLLSTSISINAQCSGDVAALQANNVRTYFTPPYHYFSNGDGAGYQVPKVDPSLGIISKKAIFSGNFWLGGLHESGQLRVAANTAINCTGDFFSGPLNDDGSIIFNACNNFAQIWEINEQEVNDFINSGYNPEMITQNIKNWPGRNNPLFNTFNLPQNLDLAPFVDTNNDGTYNPLDGDYPVIKGTQNFWWVFNESALPHGVTGGNPLKVQIAGYGYAIASEYEALNNTTFWEFEITNKSQAIINDFYMGFWLDFDLGNYSDDYVGCLPNKNTVYAYNMDDFDGGSGGYGEEIPIVAMEILQGFEHDEGFDTGLSSFLAYNCGTPVTGEPTSDQHFYNYMQGIWKDGTHLTNPLTGEETNFMFSGNPSINNQWSQCQENSTSGYGSGITVSSTGPTTLSVGEKTQVKYAIYWVPDVPHPCPNVCPYLEVPSNLAKLVANSQPSTSFESITTNKISISPNPATTQINFHAENDTFDTLEIHSLNGKLIQSYNGYTKQLSVANLPNGQYLISFLKNGKRIGVEKVVVLK